MNLISALDLVNKAAADNAPLMRVFLACGFTPLHLHTFTAAHLRQGYPGHRISVGTGLFADLVGNLERLRSADFDAVAVVIEWEDLDPRLGIRSLGGWQCSVLPDILDSASRKASRLEEVIRQISTSIPTIVCLPSLPLSPLFYTPLLQSSSYELQLRHIVASFAISIANERNVRFVSAQYLDQVSPIDKRFDVKAGVTTGFPYKLAHADAVAGLLVDLIQSPTPRKGLITDLDDTMWAGILGEVGTEGVSWDIDQHSHMHGLYQQFLASLASAGVLIGVASKNDPSLVDEVFKNRNLRISRDSLFPLEVGWNRKSESVQRILEVWNVGAESVVFIDDSAMEVAEVTSAHPQVEGIRFPKDDYQGIWALICHLRNTFGKRMILGEDSVRLQGIRNAEPLRRSLGGAEGSLDDFLRKADASIVFEFGRQGRDDRALELINKTNQFNLNGNRLSESGWLQYLDRPETFFVTSTYTDKYGPLGKISVIMGRSEGELLVVDTWVMSCRAFSRRIEHHCLKYLFEKFSPKGIVFDCHATARNGPLQDFFSQMVGSPVDGATRLSRTAFFEKTPSLFHKVREVDYG